MNPHRATAQTQAPSIKKTLNYLYGKTMAQTSKQIPPKMYGTNSKRPMIYHTSVE
jgi:hypothetical protein